LPRNPADVACGGRYSPLRLRRNVKTSKWCEPSILKVLLHRRCALFVPGVDDHYLLEALHREKPSNFLSGSLEDGIVSVHPMQVVIKKDHLELVLAQRSKCRLSVLGKDRLGQALSKPRDAIFRVLHN